MKKILIISLLTALVSFSCTDNLSDKEETENRQMNLKSAAVYSDRQNPGRGTLSEFTDGDTIGLYLPEYYFGSQFLFAAHNYYWWELSSTVLLPIHPVRLQAFYPYRHNDHVNLKDNYNGYIDVDHDSQADYMYGGPIDGSVSWSEPDVFLLMKHAMALVQFRFIKNGYYGEGSIQKISVRNADGIRHMHSRGRMSVETGEIEPLEEYYDEACIMPENMQIPDIYSNEKEYVRILIIPTQRTKLSGDLIFEFTIDGRIYTWPIGPGCRWEKGMQYTYEVEMVALNRSSKSVSSTRDIKVVLTETGKRL
ncbi:MAG TPA: fimbrillin family protein [Dysgonomonas sp.]|uniref:fimbrillin family protein n=1 Tax=unclassified Dysgonomonas TaxID=2630389 RepID=UPI0025B874DE|nr:MULTISPECIES: fimbrillin family protein [unclassified Dysgonomonas]HML65222.1 fimbrillin family protein [Dysgonomonas sp.]